MCVSLLLSLTALLGISVCFVLFLLRLFCLDFTCIGLPFAGCLLV